jgi:hypothetical protein
MKTLLRIIAMVMLTMLMLSLTKCGRSNSEDKRQQSDLVAKNSQTDLQQEDLKLTYI